MNYNLNLRHLRFLVSLEVTGHFGRAAQAENVTQSTLSAGIRELEATLGAALVDRTTRRVAFTPLGMSVAERARDLLARADDLVTSARASGRPLGGPMNIGVIPTIGPFLLPRILPGLKARFPDLEPRVTEDLTDRLAEALAAGRLDAAILALPHDLPGLETLDLFEDPFLVALCRDHPLAKVRAVPTARLADERLLLLRDGHCLREHALAACDLTGVKRDQSLEATSLHTLVQMVDGGMGVTLVPRLGVEAGLIKGTRLVTRPLLGDRPARRVGLAYRRGTARAGEFAALGAAIAQLAGDAPDDAGIGAAGASRPKGRAAPSR